MAALVALKVVRSRQWVRQWVTDDLQGVAISTSGVYCTQSLSSLHYCLIFVERCIDEEKGPAF